MRYPQDVAVGRSSCGYQSFAVIEEIHLSCEFSLLMNGDNRLAAVRTGARYENASAKNDHEVRAADAASVDNLSSRVVLHGAIGQTAVHHFRKELREGSSSSFGVGRRLA